MKQSFHHLRTTNGAVVVVVGGPSVVVPLAAVDAETTVIVDK